MQPWEDIIIPNPAHVIILLTNSMTSVQTSHTHTHTHEHTEEGQANKARDWFLPLVQLITSGLWAMWRNPCFLRRREGTHTIGPTKLWDDTLTLSQCVIHRSGAMKRPRETMRRLDKHTHNCCFLIRVNQTGVLGGQTRRERGSFIFRKWNQVHENLGTINRSQSLMSKSRGICVCVGVCKLVCQTCSQINGKTVAKVFGFKMSYYNLSQWKTYAHTHCNHDMNIGASR